MNSAIIELDLHGMTLAQAKARIEAVLRRCDKGVYRVRIIHGSSHGTGIRDMIREQYAGGSKRVRRIETGLNPGVTELVLREWY